MRPQYERVLLKISGEALLGRQASGIDDAFLDRITHDIGGALALGVKTALVVGGGNFLRGADFAKRGGDRVAGDQMGMLATVMNAIAIEQSLRAHNIPARVFSAIPVPTLVETFTQHRALDCFEAREAVIFSGGAGHPFITTDTGAALRAAEMRCDALFKGTNVDVVYCVV
jgi:uridylate kinase